MRDSKEGDAMGSPNRQKRRRSRKSWKEDISRAMCARDLLEWIVSIGRVASEDNVEGRYNAQWSSDDMDFGRTVRATTLQDKQETHCCGGHGENCVDRKRAGLRSLLLAKFTLHQYKFVLFANAELFCWWRNSHFSLAVFLINLYTVKSVHWQHMMYV